MSFQDRFNEDVLIGSCALQVLEWYIAVRVDGTAYKIYGNSNTPSIAGGTEKMLKFTPTQSSFLLQAGSVNVNMTFLSPIEVRGLQFRALKAPLDGY